jgi:hypothetical protein
LATNRTRRHSHLDGVSPEAFESVVDLFPAVSRLGLKAERKARKVYRTRDDARQDVLDCIERLLNHESTNLDVLALAIPTPKYSVDTHTHPAAPLVGAVPLCRNVSSSFRVDL